MIVNLSRTRYLEEKQLLHVPGKVEQSNGVTVPPALQVKVKE
jgi:hypothetical protein